MIINDSSLRNLFVGYNAAFKNGFGRVEPFTDKVAMTTTSGTSEETYHWLGQFPRIREWLGDRVVNNISARGYTIKNRLFESTVAVPRVDIEDDRIGVYSPMMDEMGKEVAEFPDKLMAELINAGFTSPCYDNQNFFDADHPVIDAGGAEYSVSNLTPGNGPAWYLLDGSRSIAPLIYQKRLGFEFQSITSASNEHVFFEDEYVYGVRGRSNAGYGFWQLAHASKAELTPDSYEAARIAMTTMRGDGGRPLGIKPTILLVSSELEGAGRRVINAQVRDGGASNEWAGSADLIVTPWLSA